MNWYLKPYSNCIYEEHELELMNHDGIMGFPGIINTYWCINKNLNTNGHSTLKLQKETYLDDDKIIPSICERCKGYICKDEFQLLDKNKYFKEEVD